MRILFLCGRELSYSRNEVLLRAFQRFAQVDVVAPTRRPRSLIASSALIAARGAAQLLRRRYDLVFIGFYGYLILQALRPLIRAPLVFDAFVSNYDTLIDDRRVAASRSSLAAIARWLDRSACRAADVVLLDTPQHVDYFVETFGLPAQKFHALPVGCNEEIFRPQPLRDVEPGEPLRVLYYCTYLPLHGAETVVRAAAKLTGKAIHFRLIGDGPQRAGVEQIAREVGTDNVEFVPPISLSALAAEIAGADICLGGHFGTSDKAGRVVPGKIYQMLAIGRPIIAGDTTANRSLLTPNKTALLVPPHRVEELAAALTRLYEDHSLRARLADEGSKLFQATCSENEITRQLQSAVQHAMSKR